MGSGTSSSKDGAGEEQQVYVIRHDSDTIFRKLSLVEYEPLSTHELGYVELPRGGYIVHTESLGPIQFGIPPETVKDSLDAGFAPPSYYVVVGEMFDRDVGLSKAEFEFPVYFNFFCKQQRVKIITDAQRSKMIKNAFQETLFGPVWLKDSNKRIEELAKDFAAGTDPDAFPRVWDEGVGLDNARATMRIESLIEFVNFDPGKGRKVSIISEPSDGEKTNKLVNIKVKTKVVNSRASYYFEVSEGKNKLAEVPENIELRAKDEVLIEDGRMRSVNIYSLSDTACVVPMKRGKTEVDLYQSIKPFNIPEFGITILGCSHGFDRMGKTTGFVLWMHRKGIVVDPPPFASNVLERACIPPSAIEGVILTHCHADHDAGTFQKILRERKINLFTTRTIRDSFIRKYSSITGFSDTFLNSLMHFHAVKIGEPLSINQGSLRFFYSLHTIPCIGFVAEYGGESIVYSGDTCYNPSKVNQMFEMKQIGKLRANQLLSFEWEHSLVLHEMGVPPIHTSGEELVKVCELKENKKRSKTKMPLRERLLILHAEDGLAEKYGLKQGHEFMTIEFPKVRHESKCTMLSAEQIQSIGIIQCISWVRSLQDNSDLNFNELAEMVTRKEYNSGDVIFKRGDIIDSLYIVLSGLAEACFEASPNSRRNLLPSVTKKQETYFNIQSCIGEHSLLAELKNPGNAILTPAEFDLVAYSKTLHLVVLEVSAIHKWLSMQSNGSVKQVMGALDGSLDTGTDPRIQALASCPDMFRILKDQIAIPDFASKMKEKSFTKGESLCVIEQNPEFCFLIVSGRVIVSVNDSTFRGLNSAQLDPHIVGRGMFIADINNLQRNKESYMLMKAVTDVKCYTIAKKDIVEFTEMFPGVLLRMLDNYTIPAIDPVKFPPDPDDSGEWDQGHEKLNPGSELFIQLFSTENML